MLELRLIDGDSDAYRAIVRALREQGHREVAIHPDNALAAEAARHAREAGLAVRGGADAGAAPRLLTETDPAALSVLLHGLTDLESGVVVAPRTRHAWDARPLFLISIPKAGTHLLYALAESFGYRAGVVCGDAPRPGHWYCVEHANSHTRATDFFIDTVRRSPFGNRHHPFMSSPALFIYRNPLDILVSEANYYHRDGNAAFGGYLQERSFEERLLTLVDDPWLLGSARDRIAGFVPWLAFPNVVPLSFEELVGARGGGNDAAQRRLIWSLQLKLHVPGRPDEHAARVFDPGSATFQSGQIGAYARRFTPQAAARFAALDQDFMAALGYAPVAPDGRLPAGGLPARAEAFRRRPLVVDAPRFEATPIAVEHDYLGFNIVRLRGRYHAVRMGETVDLATLDEARLAAIPAAPSHEAARNIAGTLASLAHFLPVRIVNLLWKCRRWWRRGNGSAES